MNIFLSVNNGAEIITLPVIPPEISIKKGQSSEMFKTTDNAWIRIIGEPELKTISWSAFFPIRDYPFLKSREIWGFDYVFKLDTWIKQKLPIRLVIDVGNINLAVAVTNFDYTVGRDGNINYSLEFGEFNLLENEYETEVNDLMSAEYDELKAVTDNLNERMSSLENADIYNYIDDNIPSWAKNAVTKAVAKGVITGTGTDDNGYTLYGLDNHDLRDLVRLDRLGLLD